MKTPLALFASLLLPLVSACIIETNPGPSRHHTTPPPPPAGQPGTQQPPPPNTQPPPPSTQPPPPSSGGTTASVAGAWVSPACGVRTYPRKIQFDGKGNFEAQDLVSPCPPKVACIWSGIVYNKGTYTVAGGTVQLSIAQPGTGPKMQPLPATMSLDTASAAPAEAAADGSKCVYQRDAGGAGGNPSQ